MDDVSVREIRFGSAEYQDELRLRHEVLRVPLGLVLGGKDTATDDVELHLGAFIGSRLVGVLMMRTLSSPQGQMKQVQMRQVAVDPTIHGHGIGRKLVLAFEDRARAAGAHEIVMDARLTAQAFYERLGYQTTSDVYIQSTIPHVKMRKVLT
jgi:predicted GNAT family N-acyltransferase